MRPVKVFSIDLPGRKEIIPQSISRDYISPLPKNVVLRGKTTLMDQNKQNKCICLRANSRGGINKEH